MTGYDDIEHLGSRASSLDYYGHDSSVWGFANCPPEKGHVIELIGREYVSGPCWEALYEAADFMESVEVDFTPCRDWDVSLGVEILHRFYFVDIEVAKRLALRVQQSARDIRKELVRRGRLDQAGGFHNKWAIERLFEIQQGRCYYSGEALIKRPKNFSVDHIVSIKNGGTNWPANLALVISAINTWKGGYASAQETLKWQGLLRGKKWLAEQKRFCLHVDVQREKLDIEFRQRISL